MAEPLPVLLLARELGIGGCERDLTRTAKGLDRTRFLPHIGCFHSGGFRSQELMAAGIPIVCFPVQSLVGGSGISAAIALRQYARNHRIGLIHAFDGPTSIFATPVALSLRVPVVVANVWCRNAIQTRLRYGLRFVDRVADAIMVNSNAVREHLLREEGVAPEKIHLCYNGVETTIFCPEKALRPSAVGTASLVIGSVCALQPEKRLDLLLEAFAKVRPCLPGMKLLVVGSGEMLVSLEALRRRLGLEDVCIFEPAKSDVVDWMRAMDIFVLPSDTESFPNALLEAMACGCAVVGSRVGGVPEIVEEGRSGLLFDAGDLDGLATALAKLIQNAHLRSQLAMAAADRARDCFSLEQSIKCIQSLYKKLTRA